MDTLNLAENLIRLRREKEVTQEEVANFIGVTKASVSTSGRRSKAFRTFCCYRCLRPITA